MLALKQNPSSPHITAAIIVNNVLAVLISTTAIAARFISKRRIRSGFLADDYLIGIALLAGYVVFSENCISTRYGVGSRTAPNWTGSANVISYAMRLSEPTAYYLTKTSILITYIRIFPFKVNIICCYALIVLALCTMVSDWFVMLLECFPIDFSGTVTKHCLNKLATNVFFTAWNSFLDFIVFLWPVRSLWAIQMPRQQRIALIVSFSTGVIVCCFGIARVWLLARLEAIHDYTVLPPFYICTGWEVHLGIACSCIPHVKPVLRSLFPSIFKDSTAVVSTTKRSRDPLDRPGQEFQILPEPEANGSVRLRGGDWWDHELADREPPKTWVSVGDEEDKKNRQPPEHEIGLSRTVMIENANTRPYGSVSETTRGDNESERWIVPKSSKLS